MAMHEWDNFFVAMASAAAALTGLIFVGVSISLTKILSIAQLPDRALASLILLINVLIISALCLVPMVPAQILGAAIGVIGLITWVIGIRIDRSIYKRTEQQYKKHWLVSLVSSQLASFPFVIAGAVVFMCGFSGMYWLIPGIIFSLIKALMDAWVLLVEIHR